MAIYFHTKTPKKLLAAIKSAIDEGRATAWSYDKDGDFTVSSESWNRKAWLRPKVREKEALVLHIFGPTEMPVSTSAYATYHARFIEAALRHCDGLFEKVEASAMPEDGDIVG